MASDGFCEEDTSTHYAEAVDAVAAAKEAGNAALKSADLPLAIEQYEGAVKLFEDALAAYPQAKVLRNNDIVRYGDGRFGTIETAYPHFGDYVLEDLSTRSLVKAKVGKYEEVSTRFLRRDLESVPPALFELRLACLQNLALVSLKLARASLRESDFEETVRRADAALAMDGRSPKALMRKGAALIELKTFDGAYRALAIAAQETRGRDAEVNRLLGLVLAAKGKGKGKGRGRAALPTQKPQPCSPASSDSDEGLPPRRPAPASRARPGEDAGGPAAAPAPAAPAVRPVPAAGPGTGSPECAEARPTSAERAPASRWEPGPAGPRAASITAGKESGVCEAQTCAQEQDWQLRRVLPLAFCGLAALGVAALLWAPRIWDSEHDVDFENSQPDPWLASVHLIIAKRLLNPPAETRFPWQAVFRSTAGMHWSAQRFTEAVRMAAISAGARAAAELQAAR
eukprot:CAMPEP_0168368050 /NCGR_PEP_ID=MMETSP0228-20121227/6052_1 /TAXON_ID=133427 /ORGANISM="Protoceratium reticulatum, Strain CCCM 535 (=CCMP 1889)" /LENGTH=455 /DNA_ID=CAMNT_0008380887 /DNA_START=173 /DNA_END=1539 /DNA_ORIENTATION=-